MSRIVNHPYAGHHRGSPTEICKLLALRSPTDLTHTTCRQKLQPPRPHRSLHASLQSSESRALKLALWPCNGYHATKRVGKKHRQYVDWHI
eukprot:2738605-Amphidinium_carterae.1